MTEAQVMSRCMALGHCSKAWNHPGLCSWKEAEGARDALLAVARAALQFNFPGYPFLYEALGELDRAVPGWRTL